MATTLIINPGSSSKKYALYESGRTVASFRFERRGQSIELCTEEHGEQQKCEGVTVDDYTSSLHQVLERCLRAGCIKHFRDITKVGVRVVAPGTYFQQHRVVDDLYLHKLREREPAAPLHIPHTLHELEVVARELPHAQVIAVSDSAFHATLPFAARQYSIDAHDATEYDIHRFGYHGISYASVLRRVPAVLSQLPPRLVMAHVGSGVSMAAIKNGESIDTTMGFSPASGLVMGTRAGDIEPGALLELMRVKNMHIFDAQTYIQTRGGLKGLIGEGDFRHILERIARHDQVAEAALGLYAYRFQKQLGAFAAALGGIDAVVLTATAMERSAPLRQTMLAGLGWLGIELSAAANENLERGAGIISSTDSQVQVAVIPTAETDEMLRVTETYQLVPTST